MIRRPSTPTVGGKAECGIRERQLSNPRGSVFIGSPSHRVCVLPRMELDLRDVRIAPRGTTRSQEIPQRQRDPLPQAPGPFRHKKPHHLAHRGLYRCDGRAATTTSWNTPRHSVWPTGTDHPNPSLGRRFSPLDGHFRSSRLAHGHPDHLRRSLLGWSWRGPPRDGCGAANQGQAQDRPQGRASRKALRVNVG
jgi:hypothetical protein